MGEVRIRDGMKLNGFNLAFALLIATAGFADASVAVQFGENGLVEDRAAALAELVPWKAPDAALRLVDEKVEHLGGGAYAVTRTVKNMGGKPVKFKDELRVRDAFAADRYLIPCVNYHGQQRPIGAQSEACFQARFTKYRPVIEAISLRPGRARSACGPWSGASADLTQSRRGLGEKGQIYINQKGNGK